MVSPRFSLFSLYPVFDGYSAVSGSIGNAIGLMPGSVGAERANGRLTESDLRQALVAAF